MWYFYRRHTSKSEHKKLGKFGYFNTYYSSCRNSRKRGVAIIISNSLNFQMIKEKRDDEGRSILIQGRIDNVLVTFVNVYAPPESDQPFFKKVYST